MVHHDSMRFEEALESSKQEDKPVPGLSRDKVLMGALDSACNRTCAGEVWIQHFLLTPESKCLAAAPKLRLAKLTAKLKQWMRVAGAPPMFLLNAFKMLKAIRHLKLLAKYGKP